MNLDYLALQTEISQSVIDIDFETSHYNVTRWDDIIHLLCFEYSGASPLHTFTSLIKNYEMWCGKIEDETSLWETVLARSTRELCRRLWYARTMPNAYLQRYKLESKDYFLDLCLLSIAQTNKYKNLEQLLKGIKEFPEIWSGVEEAPSYSALVASYPKATKELNEAFNTHYEQNTNNLTPGYYGP